jgi:glyoxylase-like metal-dependent hydrolase (beta-lactamase superfamily II)
VRRRVLHPELFSDDGGWRFHIHVYVVRSEGRTFLLDTGIGPASAPAHAWTGIEGSLPTELADAGVDPLAIELVLISHVHDDHLGWNVTQAGTPTFPNARYVINRADWELMADATDEEDREIFEAALEPLHRAGVIELSGSALEITSELRLEHAPGHTPGHQVLAIDSGGERALLSADLVNHPVQLHQPGLAGTSDMDPERANATRTSWLERIEREGPVVAPGALRGTVREDRPGRHRAALGATGRLGQASAERASLVHLGHRGVLEPVLLVRAVAERLVARLPAPAHGLAVAHLVRRPVLGHDRDPAADPIVPVGLDADRRLERGFHRLGVGQDRECEPPRRAALHHRLELAPHLRIVRLLDHLPHARPDVAAEPCVGAQRQVVVQDVARLALPSLPAQGDRAAVRGLGAVERDPFVRRVAEGLGR